MLSCPQLAQLRPKSESLVPVGGGDVFTGTLAGEGGRADSWLSSALTVFRVETNF